MYDVLGDNKKRNNKLISRWFNDNNLELKDNLVIRI